MKKTKLEQGLLEGLTESVQSECDHCPANPDNINISVNSCRLCGVYMRRTYGWEVLHDYKPPIRKPFKLRGKK
jgi:hypothetical protein